MNILFITIAWPQEGDRNLYSDLMNEFKSRGHNVYVACADERISESRFKVEKKLNVLRINTTQIRKAGKLKKALSLPMLGIRLKRNIKKYFMNLDIDLIIGHSPPVTLSGLMKYLKKQYNAPLYYLLKDIWPHSSVDLGIIKKNSLTYHFFRWHEKRMYKISDVIGCMSPYNVSYILDNNPYLNASKVEECPNCITPKRINTNNRDGIRIKYNIPLDATVFIFSGNLSKGHGLSFYIDVIDRLSDYKKAYFLIGGSGTYFDFLEKEIDKRKLTNIFLYKYLPADDFEMILSASDVGVILLESDYTVPQFPSRLLAYLEDSKPVLSAVNKGTDIGVIVEGAGCGLSTIHGESEDFIEKIKLLSEDESLRNKFGSNARKLLENRYTCDRAYKTIIKHFD